MAWPTTSRQSRGYGAAHDKMRALLLRTVILCERCTQNGRTTVGTIADHIKPLAEGGTGERNNYQLLCRDCSDRKGLVDKGHRTDRGVDRSGRPTSASHPWNQLKRR